jgi:hypothetical protein
MMSFRTNATTIMILSLAVSLLISTNFHCVSAWTTVPLTTSLRKVEVCDRRRQQPKLNAADDVNNESAQEKQNQQQQSEEISSSSTTDNVQPIVTSRHPQKLARGTFLGFRKIVRPPGTSSKSMTSFSTTALTSTSASAALMPDGGLSPCVIRVLGVGGAGCNAVRYHFGFVFIFHYVFKPFIFMPRN